MADITRELLDRRIAILSQKRMEAEDTHAALVEHAREVALEMHALEAQLVEARFWLRVLAADEVTEE